MTYYEPVVEWEIPESALASSLAEMVIDGRRGCEGVALWLGQRSGSIGSVSHVLGLRGLGIRKEPRLLVIDSAALNDVTDFAIEHQLTLIGQIHSHGAEFGTQLSPTDRRYGIAVPGYLSAVAPEYALDPNTTITDCGIHVYLPHLGYVRLSRADVLQRVRTIPEVQTTFVTLGA